MKRVTPSSTSRLAFAMLVAIVTLAATGGLVGFAAASEDAAEVPSTFHVDAPRVGDYANYSTVRLDRAGDQWAARAVEPYMAFEWLPATTLRDAEGKARLVHTMRATAWPGSGQTGRAPMQNLFHYEVGSERLVAYGGAIDFLQSWDQSLGLPGADLTADISITNAYTFYLRDGQGAARARIPFCGAYHALQGEPRSTTDIDLFGTCALGFDGMEAGAHVREIHSLAGRFRAVTSDRLESWDALVFQSQHGQRLVQVWFNQTIPYPLQIAIQEGEQAVVVRLHQFLRGGSALLLRGDPAPLAPAPALVWAPREAWGPNDADANHPFPLSAAFHRATSDPNSELAAFRARHPDAVVVAGNYHEEHDGERTSRWWQMQFASSDAELVVGVVQHTEPSSLPIALLPETTYTYRNGTHYEAAGPHFLRTDRLPRSLPTVHSLQTLWKSYSDEQGTPNSWSFAMQCADASCTTARVEFGAGREQVVREADPTYPVAGDQKFAGEYDFLTLQLEEETVAALVHWRGETGVTYNRFRTAPAALSPSESSSTMAVYGQPVWAFPPVAAVLGAGAFAVLVGLLYWAWPVLRGSAAIGLFSRFESPKLLEHPMRREILAQVQANPGIHFAALARRLGTGYGNTAHHLRSLVAKGILAEVATPGHRCYYVPGEVGASTARGLAVIKSKGARAVLRAIMHAPGSNARAVARATDLTEPSVHYHLVRLRRTGLVEAKRGANGTALLPTAAAAEALAKTLA